MDLANKVGYIYSEANKGSGEYILGIMTFMNHL